MQKETVSFLINSDPWTEYRTRIDLLGEAFDSPDVVSARKCMITHPQVVLLISELAGWPGIVLNSHKSAGQLYHKLSFIADIGVHHDDPGIPLLISKIFDLVSPEGPFQLPMNIPVHFGGTGHTTNAWALCDAPIIVYSLVRFGLSCDQRVLKAKDYLLGLERVNGYPCAASKELGKFRGPGRKDDPCPYATMIMLKILNLYDNDRESDFAQRSVESLLHLWENSKTQHPYMFYMGNDFRKLKAPLIWYDIIHLADTLSTSPFAKNDKRCKEIVSLLFSKRDANGLFSPESVWRAWKEWDFGQKKQPSAWLTFLVYRIINRMGGLA